jgi:hypothetical protein
MQANIRLIPATTLGYFESTVLTLLNRSFNPSRMTTKLATSPMQTIVAMSAYSIEVAPDSSLAKRAAIARMAYLS